MGDDISTISKIAFSLVLLSMLLSVTLVMSKTVLSALDTFSDRMQGTVSTVPVQSIMSLTTAEHIPVLVCYKQLSAGETSNVKIKFTKLDGTVVTNIQDLRSMSSSYCNVKVTQNGNEYNLEMKEVE